VPGLVVIAGGKYTTYRVMAKDAIDAAVNALETVNGRKVPPSVTDDLPLLGAEGYHALWNARSLIAQHSGLHEARVEHLLNRYGTLIQEVLDLVADDPTLREPLAGAPDYLRAEAVYAASHEGARHLDDVLARRTRISIETFDRGVGAAEEVARLVAPVLGWSEEQIDREVEHYRKRVEAERESQRMPDDETADGARMGAPEIVPLR
jgi:glycerol-3-phosphate dehydrogenase